MDFFRKVYCRPIRNLHATRIIRMSQETLSADTVIQTLRKQFPEEDGSKIEVEDISGLLENTQIKTDRISL